MMGDPKTEDIVTSHVERMNLTTRMEVRRFTRLTNAYSKKLEFHLYAVALHVMWVNFCRPHSALSEGKRKVTPAMAAEADGSGVEGGGSCETARADKQIEAGPEFLSPALVRASQLLLRLRDERL